MLIYFTCVDFDLEELLMAVVPRSELLCDPASLGEEQQIKGCHSHTLCINNIKHDIFF